MPGAPIPIRKVCEVYIPETSVLRDQDNRDILADVTRNFSQRVTAFLRDATIPRRNPKLQPANPVPIAVEPYKPTLADGKKGKLPVQPGRLRASAALGIKVGTPQGAPSRGTRMLSVHYSVSVYWGIPDPFFGTSRGAAGYPSGAVGYLNYAGFVNQKTGTATGGGTRYNFAGRYRTFVVLNFKRIVNETNNYISTYLKNRYRMTDIDIARDGLMLK